MLSNIMHRIRLTCAFGAGLALAPMAQAQELQLVMLERTGCYYCTVFKRDVAPIYHNSPEAQIAPLRIVNLRDMPADLQLASRAHVTPTFVLTDPTGRERARMTGYPGDDFFWPYLAQMIETVQSEIAAEAAQGG